MSPKTLSHLFANFGLAGTLLLSSVAQGAGFDLTVDARQNCLDLRSGSLNSAATHSIPNGRYVVSLIFRDAKYCVDPNYFKGCPVPKTVFYITTDNRPKEWFHVVQQGQPIVIDVTGVGTDANIVSAFFIDYFCQDNSGKNILRFRTVEEDRQLKEDQAAR